MPEMRGADWLGGSVGSSCALDIRIPEGSGSSLRVRPGRVLTCAHLVDGMGRTELRRSQGAGRREPWTETTAGGSGYGGGHPARPARFDALWPCSASGWAKTVRIAVATVARTEPGREKVRAVEDWAESCRGQLDRSARLQFWLQSAAFGVVRRRSRPFLSAGQAAYGTAANRHERDHDGLAVWGSGVRVPSAPPLRPGRSSIGRAA